MTRTVTPLDLRRTLGDMLNRVALRHDAYIIQRKGRPLAALVPVHKLESMERLARRHLLALLDRRPAAIPPEEADRLANEAKHLVRRKKRT
jgi:prevent-host-death family protein